MSQRRIQTIFASLIVTCLASYIVYTTNISFLTARLLFAAVSDLKVIDKVNYVRFSLMSDTSNDQEAKDTNSRRLSFENLSTWNSVIDQQPDIVSVTNITPVVISEVYISSSNLTSEVYYKTTTMTFNRSLTVHCHRSPYVHCAPRYLKIPRPTVVQVGFLGNSSWFGTDICNSRCCHPSPCVVYNQRITQDTQVMLVYGVWLYDFLRPPPFWANKTYLVALWEPPAYTYSDFIFNGRSPWNYHTNLIMSYRLDGDIFSPYSTLAFRPKPLDKRPDYYEIAKTKTRTALWISSHCKTHSKREYYIQEMQKYIDVDIFGECGKPCSYNNYLCYNWPAKYKFYLSFENSLCADYVTEKFFKLFIDDLFVIPVVRGGTDYDKYFPSFTYINAAHFAKAKDLALHLKHLASDLKTYSKYLEYKDLYRTVERSKPGCNFCAFLISHRFPEPKTYNLTLWAEQGRCHEPKDLELDLD
ncbi:hypothetical protein BsWGS_17367 [Bradybaena similaris]